MNNSKINLNDFDTRDFNIVLIGDSHGQDLFNSLNLSRNFFSNIKFYYIGDLFSDKFDDKSNNEKFLKQANAIILSSRWDDYKIKALKDSFGKIKDLNQKIFITSRTNEYKVFSKLYTLLDYEVLFNKDKNIDYFGLKKLYFKSRVISSNSTINQKLKKFASENSLIFLNKEDYMCDIPYKECDYVDKVGNKIFYDYGHLTEYGAKYFGKKIYEINWLKLN